MGTAVDRLLIKLGRVYVPGYVRVKDGQSQRVDGYWRETGDGAVSTPTTSTRGSTDTTPAKPLRGDGSKENPYRTSNVNEAARLLGEGHHVRLSRKREVSTLLNKLAAMVDDAVAKGEKAPNYDLCKVSVPNTNLFCAESKGIPRIKMPQLSGHPQPGTPAANEKKFKPNDKGEVNLGPAFVAYLRGKGIRVDDTRIEASNLKASQNELNGGKVAGMERAIRAGKFDPTRGAIFVTTDDYIVDGHHRWASAVAHKFRTDESMDLEVRRIDLDIITVLDLANKFSHRMGIASADV